MTAGVRKIPPPMVEPTSTATALQKPSRRGSRSPQRSVAGTGGDVGLGGRIYCAAARWRRPTAYSAAEADVVGSWGGRRRPCATDRAISDNQANALPAPGLKSFAACHEG